MPKFVIHEQVLVNRFITVEANDIDDAINHYQSNTNVIETRNEERITDLISVKQMMDQSTWTFIQQEILRHQAMLTKLEDINYGDEGVTVEDLIDYWNELEGSDSFDHE